jgi:hypothetical protein
MEELTARPVLTLNNTAAPSPGAGTGPLPSHPGPQSRALGWAAPSLLVSAAAILRYFAKLPDLPHTHIRVADDIPNHVGRDVQNCEYYAF